MKATLVWFEKMLMPIVFRNGHIYPFLGYTELIFMFRNGHTNPQGLSNRGVCVSQKKFVWTYLKTCASSQPFCQLMGCWRPFSYDSKICVAILIPSIYASDDDIVVELAAAPYYWCLGGKHVPSCSTY